MQEPYLQAVSAISGMKSERALSNYSKIFSYGARDILAHDRVQMESSLLPVSRVDISQNRAPFTFPLSRICRP